MTFAGATPGISSGAFCGGDDASHTGNGLQLRQPGWWPPEPARHWYAGRLGERGVGRRRRWGHLQSGCLFPIRVLHLRVHVADEFQQQADYIVGHRYGTGMDKAGH